MIGGHKRTVLVLISYMKTLINRFFSEHTIIYHHANSYAASSINVTASPGTSVSHPTSSKPTSMQPTAVTTISYSTPKASGVVSVQSSPHGWNQSETRLWSATIQVSKSTTSPSVALSTSMVSPTLPLVNSSILPRGVEARSSHKLFLGTNFLVGTAVGGIVLLGIIISIFVLYKR